MRMQRFVLSVVVVGVFLVVSAAARIAAAAPGVGVSPTSIAFGNVHVGATTGSVAVTISNSASGGGSDTATITSLDKEVGNADCNDFTLTPASSLPANLTNGQSLAVGVTFTPSKRGAESCVVTINDNDGDTDTLTLGGTGLSPNLGTSPATLSFGSLHVGNTSTGQTVTITNDLPGNESLTWTAIVTSGNTDFSVTPASGTLAAGGSTTVTVTFAPAARGARAGTLTIGGNDAFNASDAIALDGTGTAPDLQTSPTSIDFGNTSVIGGTVVRNVTVTNGAAANEDLVITSSITAGSADYSRSPGTQTTIAPGSSATIAVTFDPSQQGTRTGTLRVSGNDPFNATDDVSLTGVGQQRVIQIAPSSLAFGNVKIPGPSATQNLTITNPGNLSLSITRLQITGTNASNFAFNGNGCTGQDCQPASPYTILGGGVDAEVFGIRCAPSLPAGNYTATVTVTGNQDTGTNTVPLTCTGTAPDISDPSPGTLAFGSRVVGSTTDLTFQISNAATGTGADTLTYSISVPAGYSIPSGCTSSCTLASGASRTVTVRFSPTARQSYNGTLTITSDDPDEATKTVTLTGQGVAPVIGNANPASQSVAFGNVDVGATSAASTISIQNTGDSTLNVTSVTLTGTNANQFEITSGTTGAHTVAANATDTWQVVCKPTSIGAKTGSLTIASDALGATSFAFALTCTGQQAVFTFSPPGGLAFPGTFVGNTSQLTATITNTGNKSGTVTAAVSGNGAFTFVAVGGDLPRTLAPGESLDLQVTFTPVNGNTISTNLTVSTNGSPASFNIPLSGDGQTTGLDVVVVGEPNLSVDLGEIRVGRTSTRHVIVTNTGDTPTTVAAPSSNDATCVFSGVTPTLPASVPPSGQVAFDVTATPVAVGAGACTVTITASSTPSRTVSFSYTGIAPEVALVTPANGILDFAGQDVDDGPKTAIVTLRNPGTDVLAISSCAITGTGAARFAIAANCSVTPLTIDKAATRDIMVTYDPSVQAEDTATLVFNSDAFTMPTVQVSLRGVGTDQNLVLPTTRLEFPDTFRYPSAPPEQDIVIQNPPNATTGQGSTLTVSMAIADASIAEAFEIVGDGTATVAPGETGHVTVRFVPKAAGHFEGPVTLINDSTGAPMAQITVVGNGVLRDAMLTPSLEIDLGTTGVGVPVRLSDRVAGGLQIVNTAAAAYTVKEIQIVDDDGAPVADAPFTVIGEPVELAPGATASYDIEFTPDEAREYRYAVAVFFDDDPGAEYRVTLRARAVDVELEGGGGCQAGGAGGGGTLVAVALALALALVGRRRRRGAAVALVATLVLGGPVARADEPTQNIEVSTFQVAPSTEMQTFVVESPVVGVNGAWAVELAVDYASNVLRATSPQVEGMTDTPIKTRTGLQLGFAYAFLGQFEAGLRVPYYQQDGSMPQFSGLMPASGGALGDLSAHVKASLLDAGVLRLGASIDVTVPTAADDQYAGVDGPSGHVRVLGGWRAARLGATVNAGFLARQPSDIAGVKQGSALTYGAGLSLRGLDRLWVIGELYGSRGMGEPADGFQQLDGVLGVRYELGRTIGVSVGGGRGVVSGVGSPSFRGFVMLDIAPRARAVEPLAVAKPRPPRDTRDDDGDGVVNADDRCASEAEDADGYQDDDGCPDPDNDGDTLADGVDKCPTDAEDTDGFQDEDGCPDVDNDGDKIPDVDDKCPLEKEDVDGYLDNDGCDDPDNDGDGIPDVIDQCVLEPETINGKGDDDGCPDPGDSLVMVMPDRIEIFDPVTFEGTSAKLSKKSANVLGQVAATMRANRDFLRVRVTVHVHPRGATDQELSDKRAKAVRDWLVQWGVEPERVEARGLGSTRPLVPKAQKGAAQLNDRVEFIILEKAVK